MSAALAAATASSTVRAVSGWAMMSSTHCSKEKVVEEVVAAGRAASEAAMTKAVRGIAILTILTCLMASNGLGV
jgi:hypothetical protein